MNKIKEIENELKAVYEKIDEVCLYHSENILNAFHHHNVSEIHFNSTTGYGYGDIGRDVIEKVYAEVLKAESALVRNQFISASHALTVCLFALLRPNDLMLSISGTPYDTLHEVIGIKENASSLKAFNIHYDQIDLIDDDFDYAKIAEYLHTHQVKLIEIQRSRGYSTRKSLVITKLAKVIKLIKEISPQTIVMIDNCYCELVEKLSPLEVGADIMVGSLIKNLGAGICSNGAYIAGKEHLVNLAAERLTLPGEGKDVGPSLGANKMILEGLYFAPSVVASALKTAVLTSKVMSDLGYVVDPKYDEDRADIVQTITFNDPDKLIKYCGLIQSSSAIDANALPMPTDMPGYDDQIIMASGSFTQGSSIELSCDGPIRKPYIAYQQGSLTYEYGKLAVQNILKEFK